MGRNLYFQNYTITINDKEISLKKINGEEDSLFVFSRAEVDRFVTDDKSYKYTQRNGSVHGSVRVAKGVRLGYSTPVYSQKTVDIKYGTLYLKNGEKISLGQIKSIEASSVINQWTTGRSLEYIKNKENEAATEGCLTVIGIFLWIGIILVALFNGNTLLFGSLLCLPWGIGFIAWIIEKIK